VESLLQKSWHGHLAREKWLFSWQIPAMNHGQDARATFENLHFATAFFCLTPKSWMPSSEGIDVAEKP
jgi:hypothetical protein